MLDDEERRLFASLSVFVGGATLTAIESLCREGSNIDVFDTVASLIDRLRPRFGYQSWRIEHRGLPSSRSKQAS